MEDDKFIDESWKDEVARERNKKQPGDKPSGELNPQLNSDTSQKDLEGQEAAMPEVNFIGYITSLAFQGEGTALYGRGTVDFDGNLDLRMKVETGGLLGIDFILFKLPTSLLSGFVNLVTGGVHITGSFDDPKLGE